MPDEEKKPSAEDFDVVIVSPDEVLFEETCTQLNCPGHVQEIAVLPDHAPLYTLLKEGSITAILKDGKTQNIDVDGGILRVRGNKVSIVVGFDTQETELKK